MKRLTTVLFATLFALGSLHTAAAQSSDDASHSVSIDVIEMNAISVGSDVTITLDAVTAGQAPTPKTATSDYDVTTNSTGPRKVTASVTGLGSNEITLEANATAPGSGSSTGWTTLTPSGVDLITNMQQVAGSGTITYRASATAQANPVSYDGTVTYTVTAQ